MITLLIKRMPPGSFWVLKIPITKKNVERSQIKEWKNTINKKSLTSTSFIFDLWYYQHCNITVEITDLKCDLLSKCLCKRTQQHGGNIKPLGNNTFVKEIMSSSYYTARKAFTDASCINDIHAWKRLFCSCYF